DLIGICSHDGKRNRVGMPIILHCETSAETNVILSEIIPRRRSVRLPAEVNSVLVVIVIWLSRCPIPINKWLPRYPGPTSPWLAGAGGLDPPKPRTITAIPNRRILRRYIEYKRILLRRRD